MGFLTDKSYLKKDIHVRVRICYKCFGYDHVSYNCDNPQRFARCDENHQVANCKETAQKCFHFGGPHSPLAFRCKTRKEHIACKIREIKEEKTSTEDIKLADGVGRTSGPSQFTSSYVQATKKNIPTHSRLSHASRTHTFAPAPAHHTSSSFLTLVPNASPHFDFAPLPPDPSAHRPGLSLEVSSQFFFVLLQCNFPPTPSFLFPSPFFKYAHI